MKKDEFIAKYGVEQWNKHLEQNRRCQRRLRESEEYREGNKKRCAEWRAANKEHKKEKTREWTEKNKEHVKEYQKQYRETHAPSMTKEEQREYSKAYRSDKIQNDPIFKIRFLICAKKERVKVVLPDEAMALLIKEARECGLPEILNMDFMMYRFNINNEHNLVYGNLEILKYFYRLMQIKAAKGEEFTETDKNLMHYFRNHKFGKVNAGVLRVKNDWVLKDITIDMAYIEDMVRNVKGLDMIISEEDYLDKKGG